MVLVLFSFARGQQKPSISGVVVTEDGRALAGVDVWPGELQERGLSPAKKEIVTTDEQGKFNLARFIPVLHFMKEGLQPLTVVVGSESHELHITMEPATNSLILRPCTAPGSGKREIGWGEDGLHFTVLKRAVRVFGGTPDVDYVVYVVKPKKGRSVLELWFGPYAMSWEPDGKKFMDSVGFAQRNLVLPNGGTIGVDSWGRSRDGTTWRQTDIVGEGARYTSASPEDAKLFDDIINSACFTPYSDH